MSGQFEKLLADLGTAQAEIDSLAKSITAGEGAGTTQAAAAAAGGAGAGEGAGAAGAGAGAAAASAGTGAAAAVTGAAAGDTSLVKSITVTLADGTEQEVLDVEAFSKSITDKISAQEGKVHELLMKALTMINGQSAIMKSMGEQIKTLSGEGRGRKTLVQVSERVDAMTLAKGAAGAGATGAGGGEGESITAEEFMAKADSAFTAKKITGLEFTKLDVMRRNGTLPALTKDDPALVKKVLTA